MKAFEVTGKIDEKGQLLLDEPLHIDTSSQVRVIILVSDDNKEHNKDKEKEAMKNRIEKVVNILMEERPLFKEELNPEEMIQHLCKIFDKNVSIGEFYMMEEEDLKNRCSGILSVQMLSGLLDDLTPEQVAIFDEVVKRK
ncbi:MULTISPECIES: hypothetical protein [Sphaerospermopsis]|jgi:hypothetical protein|nr:MULTISPECIES: hypothetical protein [Sphaerospermopsis]